MFDSEATSSATTTTTPQVVNSSPTSSSANTGALAAKAIFVSSTIMLPVRELAALVGAKVTKFLAGTATIERQQSVINLSLGKEGVGYRAPILYNTKMYVPLRALNGLKGVGIAWNGVSKSVMVNVEGQITEIKLDLTKLPNVNTK